MRCCVSPGVYFQGMFYPSYTVDPSVIKSSSSESVASFATVRKVKVGAIVNRHLGDYPTPINLNYF